jgi:Flp pilus assembly protein TadG
MKLRRLIRDENGATLVEFAVTSPFFFLLLFGFVQVASMLWAQLGLQHGVEIAARCASLSDAAGAIMPTPCYTQQTGGATANAATVTAYAAANSWGLNPPVTAFNVTSCSIGTLPNGNPVTGNKVTASYPFKAITYLYQITLTASSCYPTGPG